MKKYRRDKPLSGMTVAVRGDDVQGAIRVLKKRMQNEGIFNEMQRLQRAAGRRRWLKKIEKLKEQGRWPND